MRVLFYRRANHASVRGGDLVQLESTANALRSLGVIVEFSSDAKADLSGFDLVHCFNSPRFSETRSFFANAKRQSKPIAFSTIFWSKEDLAIGIASSAKVRMTRQLLGVNVSKSIWRKLKSTNHKRAGSNEYIEKHLFSDADILLPNSDNELTEIYKTYHLRSLKSKTVTNAIDTDLFKKDPDKQRTNYVLSVGRIENRKNTAQLIEAARQANCKLVLVGGYDKNDSYAIECLSQIQRLGMTHIEYLDPAKLKPFYYEAQVHALASWYETPGLASMEAACGGCTIVTTELGSTRQYFGDDAFYCDPFSVQSIKQAIEEAMNAPFNLALRKKIMKNYTWEHAARQTLAAYKEIV